VLDRVGQRLLDHAKGGELGAGGQRPSLAALRERDRQAGVAGLLDELAEPVERRCLGAVRAGLQHPEQRVHLGQRGRSGPADPHRRLLCPLGVDRQDPSGAAGPHDHDADAVRHDVVHLARDPAALVGHRLLRVELALLRGARRRLVQLGGESHARPHGAAAQPAQQRDRRREEDVLRVAGPARDAERGDAGQRDAQDGPGQPPLAVRAAPAGEHERREERRDPLGRIGEEQRLRERQGEQQDGHRERVAPPPQEQHAHRRREQRDRPARSVDLVREQRLGHRGEQDGRRQRDVHRVRRHARPAPHSTGSAGSRAWTAKPAGRRGSATSSPPYSATRSCIPRSRRSSPGAASPASSTSSATSSSP
jgi:hypothetical protein